MLEMLGDCQLLNVSKELLELVVRGKPDVVRAALPF
jgi:hypothetical protein